MCKHLSEFTFLGDSGAAISNRKKIFLQRHGQPQLDTSPPPVTFDNVQYETNCFISPCMVRRQLDLMD